METSRKKFIVSKSKTKTIPKVVDTEIYAHAASKIFMAHSRKCLIRLSGRHSPSLDCALCSEFTATLVALPSLRYVGRGGPVTLPDPPDILGTPWSPIPLVLVCSYYSPRRPPVRSRSPF